MEKTIEIDGKKVQLKSTAATAIIYRNQFGTDFFADVMKLSTMVPNKPQSKWTAKDIEGIDFMPFYQFLWATAKNADPKIPELVDWLSQYDSLNIEEILPEVQDLMMNSMQGKKA